MKLEQGAQVIGGIGPFATYRFVNAKLEIITSWHTSKIDAFLEYLALLLAYILER